MNQATVLRQAREAAKMSQAHLATAAGVSKRTVIRAEQGASIHGETLRCLCSVLGLDATALPVATAEVPSTPPRYIILGEHIAGRGETVVWEGEPDADAWRRQTWYWGHRVLLIVMYVGACAALLLYARALNRNDPVASLRPWLCIGGMLASAIAAWRMLLATRDLKHRYQRIARSLHALSESAFYTARLGWFTPDVVSIIERVPLPEDRRSCRVGIRGIGLPLTPAIRLRDNSVGGWHSVHIEGVADLSGLASLMRREGVLAQAA